MYKAVVATETSWFIQDEIDKSVGILHRKDDDTYLYLSPSEKVLFDEMKDVEKFFKELIFVEEVEEETEIEEETSVNNIDGYPVKHAMFYDVEKLSYTTTEGSHVRYMAGYWGIKYKSGNQYLLSLNPKMKTTETNPSIGPFNDRLICLSEINIYNKRDKK